MTTKIEIKYGQYIEGYSFGVTSIRMNPLHLIKQEPYNTNAVCGVGTGPGEPMEFTGGTLCPRCAKALGIKSADDFTISREEYDWMEAQRDHSD